MLYTSYWLVESTTGSKLLDATDNYLFGSLGSLVLCPMVTFWDFKRWKLTKPCPLLLVHDDSQQVTYN